MNGININDFTPRREGQFPEFRSSENHCVHIGENPNHNYIRQFKVDGEVISAASQEQRCDYLLLNDTETRSFYIELKGSDLPKAISQIENTIKLISPSIKKYVIFRRIVYHTGSHKTQESAVLKWKLKHGNSAKIQSRQMKDQL